MPTRMHSAMPSATISNPPAYAAKTIAPANMSNVLTMRGRTTIVRAAKTSAPSTPPTLMSTPATVPTPASSVTSVSIFGVHVLAK